MTGAGIGNASSSGGTLEGWLADEGEEEEEENDKEDEIARVEEELAANAEAAAGPNAPIGKRLL